MLIGGPILGPGTVDDLLADARLHGQRATQRMIIDWQSLGLLDKPAPGGGAGRGRGSKKAIYSRNQRLLFRALLQHRPQARHIADLTPFPVYLWLYWGDDYVPLRQVRLAVKTYAQRITRVSLDRAEHLAQQIMTGLAHADARQSSRTKLARLLKEAINRGHDVVANLELRQALDDVFDPRRAGRTLGPPAAPITADTFVRYALARERAARALIKDEPVADAVYERVRIEQRGLMHWYLQQQPALAAEAGELAYLFRPRSEQDIVRKSCSDLITGLGLELLTHQDTEPADA